MAAARKFEELDCWNEARGLVKLYSRCVKQNDCHETLELPTKSGGLLCLG
jgi:hypothetical protein